MNDSTVSAPICPCETFVHPMVISNPPGRDTLAYRVGDYPTFRQALLFARPGETELINWRPSAHGDLALQMVEWWAYLSDILTFYNERAANQFYLRTADPNQPESLQRLIRILGYRPRPGIGATGTLAAQMSKPVPFILPQGFAIQSKPGPGKQPQIFELDADTPISLPDVTPVTAQPVAVPLNDPNKPVNSLLLQGSVGKVKKGDELLIVAIGWVSPSSDYTLATVQDIQQEKDPHGNPNTRVIFNDPLNLAQTAEKYQLLKSVQSAHLWTYPTADKSVVLTPDGSQVHLESITRQIKVGDHVLVKIANGTPPFKLVQVITYGEQVWNANTKCPSDPTQPPPDTTPPTPAVPIPHTFIKFNPSLTDTSEDVGDFLLRYAWQDVGTLIEEPSQTSSGSAIATTITSPIASPPKKPVPVLLEDANGRGVSATATISDSNLQVSDVSYPGATLTAPLQVLFNLLPVSRGKTVPNEILGSGDASIPGQEFVLQKSPLTYLQSADSSSGTSYTSTLRVWVNSVEWQEVPSFYGQPADEHIFVTREDENNMTHVQFGDGINGARLPTGVNNVLAQYRYGSGADAPDAGQLTIIIQPQPNLKAILNPVAVGGGSDPDSPKKIRRYAPQSVLTFGRAISADDYETIAAQAPGVRRARSYWTWDSQQQRTLVTIYVGDDRNAVNSANLALRGAEDTNRPALVKQAIAVPVQLSFALRIDPAYIPSVVKAAVNSALLDDDTGLFGTNVIGIGQVIYQSQIYAACMGVPGVQAVHGLRFSLDPAIQVHYTRKWLERVVVPGPGHGKTRNGAPPLNSACPAERYNPGQGYFFQLPAANLDISSEDSAHAS